jgi:simple sugar transport system permease protein
MGINARRVRVKVFAFMGFGASLAGVVSLMINFTWWPTTGEGFLLVALAALFVGGTPAWGGIGTVVGGAIGAVIVSFMETGVVAAGMDGFYVQFFSGLIIILALLGHRFHGGRVR